MGISNVTGIDYQQQPVSILTDRVHSETITSEEVPSEPVLTAKPSILANINRWHVLAAVSTVATATFIAILARGQAISSNVQGQKEEEYCISDKCFCPAPGTNLTAISASLINSKVVPAYIFESIVPTASKNDSKVTYVDQNGQELLSDSRGYTHWFENIDLDANLQSIRIHAGNTYEKIQNGAIDTYDAARDYADNAYNDLSDTLDALPEQINNFTKDDHNKTRTPMTYFVQTVTKQIDSFVESPSQYVNNAYQSASNYLSGWIKV